MSVSWPEPDQLIGLFDHVRAGDPLAINDFVLVVLEPLAEYLRRRHQADEHDCNTAAADALFALVRNPNIYDPTRCSLIGFLRMSAEGDLRNAWERERRHHVGRKSSEYVELASNDGNPPTSDNVDDLPSFDDPRLADEFASFDALEHRVFELMRDGERATAVFAAALGITHQTEVEQAREVKRFKERIMKRLKRAVEGKT